MTVADTLREWADAPPSWPIEREFVLANRVKLRSLADRADKLVELSDDDLRLLKTALSDVWIINDEENAVNDLYGRLTAVMEKSPRG